MRKEKVLIATTNNLYADKTVSIRYKTDEGQTLDISFQWHTKPVRSDGYFSKER